MKDAKGNTVIADNQYSYKNGGDITQNTDQSGTHAYGYDPLDRLTSATYTGTPAESYSYDSVWQSDQFATERHLQAHCAP